MHDQDHGGNDLRDELVKERFPDWRLVLNEESRNRLAAQRQIDRRRDVLLASGVDAAVASGVDELARRRKIKQRRKILGDALPREYDAPAGTDDESEQPRGIMPSPIADLSAGQ